MSKQSKIPAAELAIFCQELYQLVQSGLPIADGLNMLLEDETDRRTKAWLAPLCAHAEEGMPLAQAMRQTEAFPDYMTDMVALAEQTGRLQDVLPALSAHYTRQDRMIDDVRRAFAVPIALFCVMLAVVFLLITQVLPVFSRVFAQIGVQMSPVAARLMHIGQVLSGAGLGIAIVLGCSRAGAGCTACTGAAGACDRFCALPSGGGAVRLARLRQHVSRLRCRWRQYRAGTVRERPVFRAGWPSACAARAHRFDG